MTRSLLSANVRKWLVKWSPLITYVIVFGIFLAKAFTLIDPDFGWHLTAGGYFLHHGFPPTDIFTYTASNFPWVSHEWLNDIFVYLLYTIGGLPLLCIVFAFLWTLALWIVGGKAPWFIVMIAVAAMLPFAGVRTLTWSVLLLAVLIQLVRIKKNYHLYIIPLLFLIWANLHGSFVIGFIYLGYEAIRTRSLKFSIITLVSIAVTFINPYGYHVYTEIFSTLMDPTLHRNITEWRTFALPAIVYPYMMLWIAVTAFGMRTVWRQWWRYLRIDILFFLASISQMRQIPLFVIASLPFTAKGIKDIVSLLPVKLDRSRRRFVAVVAFLFAVFVLVCGYLSFQNTGFNPETDYPVKEVTYLKENACKGNLFNSYNVGGYLIWKLPSEKVYIDGRMPSWTYKGEKYFDTYTRFMDDEKNRDEQITKYNIGCVLIGKHEDKIIKSLKARHWHTAVTDNNWTLLVKDVN